MAKKDGKDGSELRTALGQRLRFLREARGMTQEDVAVRAGFTSKYVSEVERGLRDLPLSTLEALVVGGLGARLYDALVDQPNDLQVARESRGRASRHEPETDPLVRDLESLPERDREHVRAIFRLILRLFRRQ